MRPRISLCEEWSGPNISSEEPRSSSGVTCAHPDGDKFSLIQVSARSSPSSFGCKNGPVRWSSGPPRRPQDRAKQGTPPNSVSKGEAKISSSRGEARVCYLTVPVWGWVDRWVGGCSHARSHAVGTSLWRPAVEPRKGMSYGPKAGRTHLQGLRPQTVKGKILRRPEPRALLSSRRPSTVGARHHQATGTCTPGAFSCSHRVAPPSLNAEIRCGVPEPPHRLFPQGCYPPAPSLDHSHACTYPRSSRLQDLSTAGLLLTREELVR